jgi:ABC-type molybdate transport system substrate-binding protein
VGMKKSQQLELARKFVTFLRSPQAMQILQQFGFSVK